MKYAIPAIVIAVAALAGCERPTSTSSTTVVKEPATAAIEKKETVVQRDVVTPAPAPSSSTNVTIDATKPSSSESSSSTSSTRVDTPAGSATKTESTKTETAK